MEQGTRKSRDDTAHWARSVERLNVNEVSGDALNLNVDGRRLTGPVQGFGQLWQKTYRVRLEGVEVAPETVVSWWKAHLPELMPDDSRFYPSLSGVAPGEVLLINATLPGIPGGMPVSTGVLILYADDESFSVMTPDGHPESGFNTFSSYDDGGVTVCQIQSLARANDPIYEFGFRWMGGGAQQERIWRHVLTGLASHFHGAGEVTVQKICVDPRLQWSQAKNIWHNAVIRTALALPGRWVRQILSH
ncbi:hypothetical protein FKZ61_000845 [Litorilinea aerophila]|uniref:DUF1990 family protein n=1 Tax=Litorilinea aerophila TaxID=1204385 RepID=A0A540VP63_9CHLR|nr:hypothetical protein [Litorilinea aerophila]MCC9074662.1 hypothetical protein [Litorilinea aerophila]